MTESERKRASLFGDPTPEVEPTKGLNLDRFTPKPAPSVDAEAVEAISEEAGFTAKHAKPTTKAPKKRDGRSLKKSPRTSQFNVRLKPETSNRFWDGAEKEGMEYADDFLAHLLDLYESRRR